MDQRPELGIYIHIPFCIKKCIYCDFTSFPDKYDLQERYIQKILEEIENEKSIFENYNVTTIYIGGGTPSSIESKYIIQILDKIKKYVDIKNVEITIELNPGTVTKQKMLDYKKADINRISIGLQSTQNHLLKTIGRIHTYEDFIKTYELAKQVGFENINVDLMIGLPNQTIQDIKSTLQEIMKLKLQHISVYSLIIEPDTELEELIENGKLTIPSDEEERKQYQYVKNILELEGYIHYEISNFSLPGKQSKHNTNCWEQKEYIGFGLAAHSYIDKKRFSNTNDMDEYLNNDYIQIKILQENQTQEEQEKEYMLLGLRKLEGVQIQKFKQKFGKNPLYIFRNEIEELTDEGLLEVELDNIKLTRKGLDFANLVWEEFI